MYKTGIFIPDSTAFCEKDWGKDTAIYLKLINELSEPRWKAIYSALKTTADILDELKEFSKANPDRLEQDEPDNYHIQDSDPIDPSEGTDVEY